MAIVSEESKRGYYDPKMYQELVINNRVIDENTMIIFDTNIILNMYFIEDRQYLRKYLIYLSDYMWIPRRVYEEYNNNRENKINEILSRIDGLKNYKFEIKKYIDNQLKQYEFLPTAYGVNVREQVDRRLGGTIEYIEYIEDDLKIIKHNISGYRYAPKDEYLKILEEVLFTKLGRIYSEDEIEQIKHEAINEYGKAILPGYEDYINQKETWEGDYVIWKQVIEESTNKSKNVIWVTHDMKESKNHPEYIDNLKNIFREKTGKNIEIINFSKLIEHTTKSCNSFQDLASKMRDENKDWTKGKSFFNKKYTYLETLEFIGLERRQEYRFEKRENNIAFLELTKIRTILEATFQEILCSQIYTYYYALALDVLIKKEEMMIPVCTITYKADTSLIVYIDVKEGTKYIANDDKDQLPRTGYEVEILTIILKYICEYIEMDDKKKEKFKAFLKNIGWNIENGYYF